MKKYLSLVALLSISTLSYGNPRAQLLQSAIQRGVRLKAGNLKGLPANFSRMMSSDTNQPSCQGCSARKEWLDKQLQEVTKSKKSSPVKQAAALAAAMPVGATLAAVITLSSLGGVSYGLECLSLMSSPEGPSFAFPAVLAAIGGGLGFSFAQLDNEVRDAAIASLEKELDFYSKKENDLEQLD